MHNNFIDNLGLSGSEYDAFTVNPGWEENAGDSLPGDQWWSVVSDAQTSIGEWKRQAESNLPLGYMARDKKNKLTFIQALLDNCLTPNFTAVQP